MNETEKSETHELPTCKDFLAQLGPIDTLLGSVSYNEIDNTDGKLQQLRTSARVFKKMKFDQCNNAAALEKKEKKEEVKQEEVKPEVKKSINPLWTSEEKKMFFEALNEYGKDFESIHMSICNRLKKKGIPDDQLKTKYQVRHFYYKTFHMLYGGLKFNEKIPKNVQELYSLINYGEMRKKIGSVSKKTLSKLGDLIANGFINVRLKGKTIKIKTPMCRALRRLNQLDEKYDDLKLPTRVLVELRPKDMVSFLRIQSIAQNPRIKVAASLQKRLSSLITCINSRWKTSEAVVYDKAVISTNHTTKDFVPDKKIIEENSILLTPSLRLAPPVDAHVELPSIDISEYFSGQSISLNAFEMRKGVRTKEEIIKKEEQEVHPKNEKSSNKQTTEKSDSGTSVTKVINEAVNTLLSLQTLQTQEVQNNHKCDNKHEIVKVKSKDIPQEEKQARIEEIRKGWTVENCGSLTVGELYLMFGSDSKLTLDYSWDPLKLETQENEVSCKPENDLTSSLKKLLALAKLHCNKTVMKCSCGHVCGGRNSSQFKKPLSTKVVKRNHINTANATTAAEEKANASNNNPVPEPKPEEPEDDNFLDASSPVVQLFNQRESFEKLNPKMRNRFRNRYRQLVVERKLVPNKSESKHQIVSMNIVPQENPPREEVTNLENKLKDNSNTSGLPSLLLTTNSENKVAEDTCLSNKDFTGLLEDKTSSNMSTGITKILKENENQWISSDVADYSLSSLLGHLDCPTKTNDDTRLSELAQDVDAQLHTLLLETSVDYTAKFADLAAQVVDNKK